MPNELSLQSFYHISEIDPGNSIERIAPLALLYLAATEDPVTGPIEEHKKVFQRAGEPKEFVTLNDVHIANYFGKSFEANVAAQIDFLKRHL